MVSDILKHEIIGKDIEVVESKNKDLLGLKGKVIDETKNTFTLEMDGKRKVLLKDQIKFIARYEEKNVKIDGSKICFRPEDRVKKIR